MTTQKIKDKIAALMAIVNGISEESVITEFPAIIATLRDTLETIEYYANHESVIKEVYHSNDNGQITCVHTFIGHKAKAALDRAADRFGIIEKGETR